MTNLKHKYLYGGRPTEAESPAGRKGMIARTLDGAMTFLAYHDSERSTNEAGGRDGLEIPYSDDRELVLDVLKHGPDVEVLGPKSLRREVFG